MKRFARFWALPGLLLLTGCNSLPAPSSPDADSVWPPVVFVSEGKMSLRSVDDSAIQGFSANFRWQQTSQGYDIELWGALGQGRTRITGTARRIMIVDGSGRVVKSRHPERLLQRHLGWSLPLAALPYWLQGKAAPTPPADLMHFQANTDLERLEQSGWTLEFTRYQDIAGAERSERLPGRVRASNPALKLTIVTRDWQL